MKKTLPPRTTSSPFFLLLFPFFLLLPYVAPSSTTTSTPPPPLPLQFSADLEIVSHLIDRNQDYPPWKTKMIISYDHVQGWARVEVKEGRNEGKLFIRRYDEVSTWWW